MTPWGARAARREAERACYAAERQRLRPVEMRLGRLPKGRWLYLCTPLRRIELAWSDEEALDHLVRSEDCIIPVAELSLGDCYYLYDRRVYTTVGRLTPQQLREAPRNSERSTFLPIVQIEVENDEPARGTTTFVAPGTPQQIGEPPKFIPATTAKTRVRKPIRRDVGMFVWQRDQGRCVYCGSQERLEYDHIIPWADGGSDTARNLQLLCESCNRRKGRSI